MHGKYLGVDYGDVRTGLAVSDIGGTLAGGICTVKEGGMRATAMRVAKEAKERACVRIVVGLPRNMDGTEGERAHTVRKFVSMLCELTDVPVDTYDERMSTMEAYRYLGQTETYGKARRAAVDTLSAQIILQDYLDAQKNRLS